MRHAVGEDGTTRYRFTFEVSLDSEHYRRGNPAALGRDLTEALLASLKAGLPRHG